MQSKSSPAYGQTTRIIHNRRHEDSFGSPYSPVYNTTTYRYPNTASLEDVIEGRTQGNLYTRWGSNPSILELEQGLADLEGAGDALAFAAGMAAISATFFAHGRKGIVCVGDLYGGTQELLTHHIEPLGIPVTFLLHSEISQLDSALNTPGKLVYCESPANPTLNILDIHALAEQSHARGAMLAVDNTFATPINQRPLALGADISIHSASKYLGGHSDLTAGAVMASAEKIHPIAQWRKNLGQILAPDTSALLSRSLRTLPVRIKQHNNNALAIAQAMSRHPAIKQVLYPGLSDFSGHNLARQQMDGYGGMLTIDIAGGKEQAARVADSLQIFLLATSLGGVESLVSQPCITSHHGIPREERERHGITDGMLRLSVGLEDEHDLIADLQQALDRL
ncbi:trans-sulfuration enzyme family protein [Marinobacter piscensis]|uniref:trans-sulfuration enzyme family protein n=1 Tax=Marinobacter piscensis TaxID=1562308 RepID=UPI0011A24161|nr:aminotransferase class I/II-fold pyridoxal phosphate-dependent enzyme [Marinobacter piscensis]